jgi:hypothetical protein
MLSLLINLNVHLVDPQGVSQLLYTRYDLPDVFERYTQAAFASIRKQSLLKEHVYVFRNAIQLALSTTDERRQMVLPFRLFGTPVPCGERPNGRRHQERQDKSKRGACTGTCPSMLYSRKVKRVFTLAGCEPYHLFHP